MDFSPKRIASYEGRFGEDFCLVVTGDPEQRSDFYAIPRAEIREVFTEENRFPVVQKNGKTTYRWQMHLYGPPHHFQLEFARSDQRDRPRFDATTWYGNSALLDPEGRGDPDAEAAGIGDDEEVDDLDGLESVEGRERMLIHRRKERDANLARLAKRQRFATQGHLACDVCAFDFAAVYGDLGGGFIEAHHRVPLRELVAETITKVDDLQLVCANCHRMLHRGSPWLSIDQLKAVLVGRLGGPMKGREP